MINCLTELFGLDGASAYAHAFTFLRALAVAVRGALVAGADAGGASAPAARAAVSAVASWASLNALRALTAIVCAHGAAPAAPLWELVYPLAQVLGALPRVAPSPAHYPLRLHAAALLAELQWATGVYVPAALPLLDVLRSRALARKPRGAAPSRPTPIALLLRVGAAAADTKAYQDALVSRTLELLLDALRAHFASPALPELAAPVVVQLRIFAAAARVPPWKARARALIETLTEAAAAVAERRAALPFAPGDVAALASFMAAEAAALRAARAAARTAAVAAELGKARAAAADPQPLKEVAEDAVRAGGSDEEGEEEEAGGTRGRGAGGDDDDEGDGDGDDDEGDDGGSGDGENDDGDGDGDGDDDDDDDAPAAPAPVYKHSRDAGAPARGRFRIVPSAAAAAADEVADIGEDFF
jgi:hypothetical protein